MIDHERLVISALLRYHAQIPRIIELLRPEMFEDGKHQQMFLLLVKQATTSYPHTVETFVNFLDQTPGDQTRKREVVEYIISLTGEFAVIQKPEFEHALESIRQGHQRRVMLAALTEAIDKVQGGKVQDAADVFSRTLDTLANVNGSSTFSPFLADTVLRNYKEGAEDKLPPGIPFGFPKIDAITGGHRRGNFVVWGGYTSEGKTRFAIKATHRAASLGYNTLFVSLEMKNDYIMVVMSCAHTYERTGVLIDINRARFGKLLPEEYRVYEESVRDLETRGKIYLWSPGRCSIADIRRRVAALKISAPLDMVVIDYLKLVTPERERGSAKEELDQTLRDAKHLGMTEDVSVIGLHQMSRAGRSACAERGYYILEDYGDTSEVERNADIAGWSYMPEEFERQCESKVGLAKVREGAKLIQGYMICSDMAHGVLCERQEGPANTVLDRFLR